MQRNFQTFNCCEYQDMKIVGEKAVHYSLYLFDSLPILFDSVSKTATRMPLAKTIVYRAFSVDEIQAAGMNPEPFVSRKPCAHLQSPMGAHSPDIMSRTTGVSADGEHAARAFNSTEPRQRHYFLGRGGNRPPRIGHLGGASPVFFSCTRQ